MIAQTNGKPTNLGEHLVIGAAVGYTAEQVLPFLTSLRHGGYSGSVVLFVDRALERQLRRHPITSGVRLIRAHQWLPFKLGLADRKQMRRFFWSPLQGGLWALSRSLDRVPVGAEVRHLLRLLLGQVLYTPMEARFLRYYRFVRAHPAADILLSDVRDVLFQNDPFTHLPATGLAVSIETPSYTVASEPHNAEWVKRVYGPTMLAQIGANRVSCVGVTYGDHDSILAYLKLVTDEILSMTPRRAGTAGADTAIHNMLLWTNRLGSVHWLEPLVSAVATLNGVDESHVRIGPQGKLLNTDGREASVLHQYDRLPRLAPRLLKTLAS